MMRVEKKKKENRLEGKGRGKAGRGKDNDHSSTQNETTPKEPSKGKARPGGNSRMGVRKFGRKGTWKTATGQKNRFVSSDKREKKGVKIKTIIKGGMEPKRAKAVS